MILQFDPTCLEFFQREDLRKILDVIQSENVGEIVVYAVELPFKFLVVSDDDIELLVNLQPDSISEPELSGKGAGFVKGGRKSVVGGLDMAEIQPGESCGLEPCFWSKNGILTLTG